MGPGLPQVVDRLRETLRPADAGGPTDAELLRRWVTGRDEAAFELLVWRHGRLVASVCRRLLRRPEDVEDAFQATFLVLVRKAGGIRGRQAVAAWLHTVAHRVAVAAAARANRLPAGALPDVPTTDPPPADADLRQVIDAEVRRLPERYRQAFVLCCLDGQTAEQAAGQLGVPAGTVLSRLSRARQRLRDRLTRRGLAPSLVPLDGALVGAAVSATLVNATVAAATTQAADGAVPASAAVLVTTVLRGMVMTKLKGLAIVVLLVAVVCGGGVIQLRARAAEQQARAEQARAEAERQRAAAEAQRQRAPAETEMLRTQVEKLRWENAELIAILQAVRRFAPSIVPPGSIVPDAPVGPPETELLKFRVEAKMASWRRRGSVPRRPVADSTGW
ncbi:MAG: sigma-70 family RNA polymerase sigma factor [Gemmataceae bacterium]